MRESGERPATVDDRLYSWRRPATVAGVALLAYAAWIATAFARGHEARDFATIGRFFASRSHASGPIFADAAHAFSVTGFDGQFYLYIAQDPGHASAYLDMPAYRFTHILYPMLARLLALGRPDVVPAMLIATNVAAVAVATLLLAVLVQRRGGSPWLALVFALYPGVVLCVHRDLTEPVAYAVVATAILAFESHRPWRLALSCALFAAALFARELTVIFLLAWAATLLGPRLRGWPRALAFVGCAVLPFLVYKAALSVSFGSSGVPSADVPSRLPFYGLYVYRPWPGELRHELVQVMLPTVVVGFAGATAVWRRVFAPELIALLASVALVAFLPKALYLGYTNAGRVASGLVFATVLASPAIGRSLGSRYWLVLPAALWMTAWLDLARVIFRASWA